MNDAWTDAAEKLAKLRTENERLQAIVDVATAFVMAHCALEMLAHAVGADAACISPLNDRVIREHIRLEAAVLGDHRVPGRRQA